jgi:hypothetical protein
MITSPVGLGPEKVCTDEAQQELYITDTSSSRQRGRPTSAIPQLFNDN